MMPPMLRARHVPFRIVAAMIAGCACTGLAGCSAVDMQGVVTSDPNVPPANYRSDILAFLRTYLNDPTRIRSAYISEPALRPTANGTRYGVCLRFNARKSGGEYEGNKERIVFFLGGRLDAMIEVKKEQCADAAYQPFPELEQLTR
jgi:hypothetical protein